MNLFHIGRTGISLAFPLYCQLLLLAILCIVVIYYRLHIPSPPLCSFLLSTCIVMVSNRLYILRGFHPYSAAKIAQSCLALSSTLCLLCRLRFHAVREHTGPCGHRGAKERKSEPPGTSAKADALASVLWTNTTMSNPYLPPGILDYIIDLLHDNPRALKECCLVSKSWIPPTRKHLFAHVRFGVEADLDETFPDPSTSPARYTKTLHVGCLDAVTPADTEPGGWIRDFSRVVNLEIKSRCAFINEPGAPLVQFHGLSPVIKSLRVDFLVLPPSWVFNLILSFPLLEDLALFGPPSITVMVLMDCQPPSSPRTYPRLLGSWRFF